MLKKKTYFKQVPVQVAKQSRRQSRAPETKITQAFTGAEDPRISLGERRLYRLVIRAGGYFCVRPFRYFRSGYQRSSALAGSRRHMDGGPGHHPASRSGFVSCDYIVVDQKTGKKMAVAHAELEATSHAAGAGRGTAEPSLRQAANG